MTHLRFCATECDTVHDALTEARITGETAISLLGNFFTMTRYDLEQLERKGIQPTIYSEVDGKIMSTPGRHG